MKLYWITHCGNLAVEAESMFVTTEHFTDEKKYLARLEEIERIHENDHDEVESYQNGEIDLGSIAVVLEGGMVQSVVTSSQNLVGLGYDVIDYDTDGGDEADFYGVPQEDGTLSSAYVTSGNVSKATIGLDKIKPWAEFDDEGEAA
jgi:hypothetical protein